MNIALISAFRNAEKYLARYARQVGHLEDSLRERRDSLHCIWGEGDSTDTTLEMLRCLEPGFNHATITDCTHHGSLYGPVVDPQRFKQLAYVGNCLWAAIPDDADVVIFVESDLIWDAATMLALLADLDRVPCVAPMILDSPPENTFYDTWAFRRHGAHFSKSPPYVPLSIKDYATCGGLEQLDSAGSCLVMNAELARHLTWPEADVVVGLCKQINELGGAVWLDPALTIFHP